MKTIRSLSELSIDELRRIRETLRERYHVGDRGNVIEIGFGLAERGSHVDWDRGDAICFYVSSKRTPRRRQDRIPEIEAVRVKRGSQFVEVCLPTDVLETKVSRVKPTGRSIRHLSDRARATAGAIVAWRDGDGRRLRWGVTTVGHLFHDREDVPEDEKQVRVKVPGNREIEGRLLLRSEPDDGFDAALVSVQRRSLIRGDLMSANQSTRGKVIRSVSDLIHDRGNSGLTLPGASRVPMIVLRYLPEFDLVPSLGRIEHFLETQSDFVNTFGPGYSGTLWIIRRQASCHQCVGWESTDPLQNYVRGGGQSIQHIMQWMQAGIASQIGIPESDVDLRLVKHL